MKGFSSQILLETVYNVVEENHHFHTYVDRRCNYIHANIKVAMQESKIKIKQIDVNSKLLEN